MRGSTQIALVVSLAVLGAAIEARADCQYVRGSIAETRISLGTEPARFLGTVTGVLNGAVTVTLLSPPAQREVIGYFPDKEWRCVEDRRIADTHSHSGRASRRIHDTRGPGYHWGIRASTKERTA